MRPNAQGFDFSFGHMGGCIDNYSHFYFWSGPNVHDLHRNGVEIFENGKYFPDLMLREANQFIREQKKPFFLYYALNTPHYPYQGDPSGWSTSKIYLNRASSTPPLWPARMNVSDSLSPLWMPQAFGKRRSSSFKATTDIRPKNVRISRWKCRSLSRCEVQSVRRRYSRSRDHLMAGSPASE